MAVILPIEGINREFDSKLILAGLLASGGEKVFIGQHNFLNKVQKYFPPSLYVGKNMFRRTSKGKWISEYENLKLNGHKIIHLDEEGAVYWGDENEWKRRLLLRMDTSRINSEDVICTWGEFQKEFYKEVTKSKKIFATGHPRFSFSKGRYLEIYKKDLGYIKKKYGNFVLLTTAYQWSNNALGHSDSFSERLGYDYKDAESLLRSAKYWTHSSKMCAEFIKLAIELSVKIDSKLNIVIRPHPAEDLEVYEEAFKNIKNVFIDRSFSVSPWLLGCECLISEGCTTTIEAFLLGKKVCLYHPFKQEDMEMFLPSLMGEKCSNINEVLKFLTLKQKSPNSSKNDRATKMMINLQENVDSFKFIESIILKEKLNLPLINKNESFINIYLIAGIDRFIDFLKNIMRNFFPRKKKIFRAYSSAFFGFNKGDIEYKVKEIEKFVGKELKVEYFGKKLFAIKLSNDH